MEKIQRKKSASISTNISQGMINLQIQSVRKNINPNFFKVNDERQQNGLLVFDKKRDFEAQQEEKLVEYSGIRTVTSEKPLKLAWIFDTTDIENLKFKSMILDQGMTEENKSHSLNFNLGKLALSQCPGKKIEKGRDGKRHDRDIFKDIEAYANQGINLIICLLSDSELRSLGLKVPDYELACDRSNVILFKYPIIEMAPPENLEQFHKEVVEVIVKHLLQNKGNVLIHCRGGVGRAGLLACCVLSYFCEFGNFKKIIEFMRKRRDKRCVESRKQEDFVKAYFNFINSQ
ncbi:dual specificity protein phosphatase [Stylonychia lemnae]|uniref:Dual specificity protein phosphatase n=1 Tax=Stylonychia lemnae TaxID=5949 RepID=A0A078A7K7_STYLE|nr:dual specificity protein phosphatase [Stylonychia lemnae]|eukprot:CDW77542.1 dual specificity protein phosphatase [Stylonychia lemnae]